MVENIIDLIYNEIPRKILVCIYRQQKSMKNNNLYAGNIYSKIDATRSHAVRTIQKLEEQQLVKRKQKGRKKIIKLTPKGEKQ